MRRESQSTRTRSLLQCIRPAFPAWRRLLPGAPRWISTEKARSRSLGPARLSTVPASDSLDADSRDVRGVGAFGRIEVLPVHGNGAPGTGGDLVAHASRFRASSAVCGLPMNAVMNQTAAAARHALLSVDPESN